MNLKGAHAVVTGASSGIGEATATLLAARGARVALIARNRTRLEAVALHIRESGGTADVHPGDLADPIVVAELARAILERGPVPDILVNCAGAGRWLPILDTPADEAAAMMALPYLAAFNLTRELLGGMLDRRRGHIVNVTSVASRLAWPGAAAYTAARWAMEGFTAALRADVYGSGVGVTLAMFGTVESPYWMHNPGSRERLPASAARQRALTVGEAAAAIVRGIEQNQRFVLRPRVFRLLFLLNTLFPTRVEATLCRGPRP
ncbi:MAG: SDR family NAD(P)-dependent oxidoreductase [Vicinamibacterales bacterium]|mgnify:CR=1 FL=1